MADLSGATQQDLGQLLASMRKICDEIQSSTKRFGSPSHFRSSLRRRRSEAAGANPAGPSEPITFVDSLDQARRILEQRGIITVPTTGSQSDPPQTAPAEPALPDDSPSAAFEVARPVLELGHDNALAHLAAFRDHLFPLYPCIDLALAKNNIRFALQDLAAFFRRRRPGLGRGFDRHRGHKGGHGNRHAHQG